MPREQLEEQRIAMWSVPRALSTAMLRAWESRSDTAVLDEPFYGCFLKETGADRPGREESLAMMETDSAAVVADLQGPIPDGKSIWFQKHHSLHLLPTTPREWMDGMAHFLLIRHPSLVAASYHRIRPDMTAHDLGWRELAEVHDLLSARTGQAPPILDASDLLSDPESHLEALCEALGVPFDPGMLAWPSGRRATDPSLGDPWYATVQTSTGFIADEERKHASETPEDTEAMQQVVDACLPFYEQLHAKRLTTSGS
ncbi:sulfotransferase [Glycomyces sp. L485]|uniref:sulfotransferase n=1 Tax=Glycomyces sp. L485 TaxID=2909235 RepID=UPI001F4AAC6C|nr:sulfotransferase [Glycomyces sp. L485]MCH7231774.1 sulfotransferase [Glycomyces sp. L485]